MKTLFTLKKGKHFAEGFNFGIHLPNKHIGKVVTFHPNCAYQLDDADQEDINKLYGFSEGLLTSNHYNSARFGWNYDIKTKQIRLYSYVYNQGELEYEYICSVDLNETFVSGIALLDDCYRFIVMRAFQPNKMLDVNRVGSGLGYLQFPYFGGDEVAPHDMTIELKPI